MGTYDNHSHGESTSSADSLTVSHTIGTLTNACILVFVSHENNGEDKPDGCTYNGIDLDFITSCESDAGGFENVTYLYAKKGGLPGAGTYDVVASWAAAVSTRGVTVYTFGDVDQAAFTSSDYDDVDARPSTELVFPTGVTVAVDDTTVIGGQNGQQSGNSAADYTEDVDSQVGGTGATFFAYRRKHTTAETVTPTVDHDTTSVNRACAILVLLAYDAGTPVVGGRKWTPFLGPLGGPVRGLAA